MARQNPQGAYYPSKSQGAVIVAASVTPAAQTIYGVVVSSTPQVLNVAFLTGGVSCYVGVVANDAVVYDAQAIHVVTYIGIEDGHLNFYSKGYLKRSLPFVADVEMYSDDTDLIITDGTTVVKFLGGSQIVAVDGVLTLLNASGEVTEII